MQELLAGPLLKPSHQFPFGFRVPFAPHLLIGDRKSVVGVGLTRVEPDGPFQGGDGARILLLPRVNDAEIKIGHANVPVQLQGIAQQARRGREFALAVKDVAQVSLRQGVLRIVLEFLEELAFRFFELFLFPVEVSQSEVDIGLAWVGGAVSSKVRSTTPSHFQRWLPATRCATMS